MAGTSRREFCRRVALALGTVAIPGLSRTRPIRAAGRYRPKSMARVLAFEHTHRDDSVTVEYYRDGRYLPDALRALDYFLRDHYDGSVHRIDPDLLDILYDVGREVAAEEPFQVVSAYRSPETNEMLRRRGGLVSRNSLHMQGRAIDVRVTGVPTTELRDAGLRLGRGGVGYYARSDMVHFDTGRPRRWSY